MTKSNYPRSNLYRDLARIILEREFLYHTPKEVTLMALGMWRGASVGELIKDVYVGRSFENENIQVSDLRETAAVLGSD